MKIKDFNTLKKRLLKDPKIREAYDSLDIEFQLVRKLIRARLEDGVTQADLAKRIGTHQSAIARFEAGGSNPTLEFIQKISRALDVRLQVM